MSRLHSRFSSPRTRPFDPRKSRPHQFEVGDGKTVKGLGGQAWAKGKGKKKGK